MFKRRFVFTQVRRREKRTPQQRQHADPQEDRKRYSLTLWEQYKRAHSMSLSASQSELTTPQAFTEPTQTERVKDQRLADKASQGKLYSAHV